MDANGRLIEISRHEGSIVPITCDELQEAKSQKVTSAVSKKTIKRRHVLDNTKAKKGSKNLKGLKSDLATAQKVAKTKKSKKKG